jgi:DNA methylase/Restriction endonuclease
MPGVPLQDVWTDIDPINARAAERLGYPTQKPKALLERIIQSSSNPNDLVLDPFCDCGTTVDAAQSLGRRWVGIDVTFIAVDLIRRRLESTHGSAVSFQIDGIPKDMGGARALFKADPFDFERWAVSMVYGQPNEKQVGDKGFDGTIRFPLGANNTGRALISVKGGQTLNPAMVNELRGAVERHKAEMGVLLTLREPTRGMVETANQSGNYLWSVDGRSYPKIQLVTIQQLLGGHRLHMPPALTPYIQATRHIAPSDNSASARPLVPHGPVVGRARRALRERPGDWRTWAVSGARVLGSGERKALPTPRTKPLLPKICQSPN